MLFMDFIQSEFNEFLGTYYLDNTISRRQEVTYFFPAIFLKQKYSFSRRNDFL